MASSAQPSPQDFVKILSLAYHEDIDRFRHRAFFKISCLVKGFTLPSCISLRRFLISLPSPESRRSKASRSFLFIFYATRKYFPISFLFTALAITLFAHNRQNDVQKRDDLLDPRQSSFLNKP